MPLHTAEAFPGHARGGDRTGVPPDGVEIILNNDGAGKAYFDLGEGSGVDLGEGSGVDTIWSSVGNLYTNVNLSTVFGLYGSSGNAVANLGSYTNDSMGDGMALKVKVDMGSGVTGTIETPIGASLHIEHITADIAATNAGILQISSGFRWTSVIDITGAGASQVKVGDQTFLTKFDASANTGGVTAVLVHTTSRFEEIIGGSGNDSLTVNAATGGGSITTGGGADIIKFGIEPIVGFFDNINPMAVKGATAGDLAAAVVTVTDFDIALDTILLRGSSYALSSTQQDAVTAASTLLAAANLSAGYGHAASVDNDLVTFRYGGDTNLFADGDSDGTVSVGDGIVKLAGITADLTATNYVHG